MTRKVLKIEYRNYACECIMDDASEQPFKLYNTFVANNEYGYPTKRRNLVAKFRYFHDVLMFIGEAAQGRVNDLF